MDDKRSLIVKSGALALTAAAGIYLGVVIKHALSPAAPAPAHAKTVAKTKLTPSASPQIPAGLSNDMYSLTIPAQRSREYKQTSIVPERALQSFDGYRQGLVSYVSDGLKIYAQVTLPQTPKPSGGYPVLILVHGYIMPSEYQSDEPFYTDFAVGFAKRGYLVVKPDLRGHGQSWGVPEGAYFSSGYVADTLNLAASLPTYSEANSQNVALLGHSMGGHVALEAAVVQPNLFKALVLAAPSTGTLHDMYYNWSANSDFADPVTTGIRKRVITLFGEPDENNPFWKDADPYTFLGDIKCPIQVNHSTNDDVVPYHFSQDLTAALSAAGRNVTMQTYASGHSFSDDGRPQLMDNVTAFLNQSLGVK